MSRSIDRPREPVAARRTPARSSTLYRTARWTRAMRPRRTARRSDRRSGVMQQVAAAVASHSDRSRGRRR
jgi:hypothetical protein